MSAALNVIDNELESIGIPYELMRWTAPVVPARYWVGEWSEVATAAEDGYCENTVLLTGTTKGTWAALETDRAAIERHFPRIGGLRCLTADGALAIYYENSLPVPTGEADLKRMQINLRIKEWKGMS